MSRIYTITTDMTVQLLQSADADSHPATLIVRFEVNPGREQSYLEPGEAASVSIASAQIGVEDKFQPAPDWLWPMLEADEALEAEMLAEAWESDAAARDDHADMIREERMLECGQ